MPDIATSQQVSLNEAIRNIGKEEIVETKEEVFISEDFEIIPLTEETAPEDFTDVVIFESRSETAFAVLEHNGDVCVVYDLTENEISEVNTEIIAKLYEDTYTRDIYGDETGYNRSYGKYKVPNVGKAVGTLGGAVAGGTAGGLAAAAGGPGAAFAGAAAWDRDWETVSSP